MWKHSEPLANSLCYSSFASQPPGECFPMAKREKQGKSYLYINTAKHLQLVVKIWKSNIEKYLLAWHLDFFIYVFFSLSSHIGMIMYCFGMHQHPQRQPWCTLVVPFLSRDTCTREVMLFYHQYSPPLVTYWSYLQVGWTTQDKSMWVPQKAGYRNTWVQHSHPPAQFLAQNSLG